MHSFIRTEIQGVGHYVPDRIVSNDDLAKLMDTSDEWITERSGIKTRRMVEAKTPQSTSDLAVNAAQNLFSRTGKDPAEVDLILAATLAPDYFFPGIGVLIQHKLGLGNVPAIDLRAQCSAFSWGISMADAFIKSGQYKSVLLIGSEIHSKIMEYTNRGRNISVLFGDAAGAMLLEGKADNQKPTAQNQIRGVIDSHMGSDGSGAELLAMTRPGIRSDLPFISAEEAANHGYAPFMDGKQVFKNAVTRMLESAHILLKRNSITAQDIDLVVPHQANIRINEMVRERLGLPPEKVFNNIQKYGNTTSASLPLAMSEAAALGVLKPGQLVLTVVFGAGFTWGANLIRW